MTKVKVTKKDIQQVVKLVSPESRAVREYLRNDMRDFFEHEAKGANYLLVAHGAALVACLSVLKDYSTTPYLKGIGIFIVMFAAGFLCAIFGYVFQSIARFEIMDGLLFGWPKKGPSKKEIVLSYIFLGTSMVLLSLALIIIARRFASL